MLVIILVLTLVAVYIDLPNSPGLHIELGSLNIHRDFDIKQGLDLQGGLQVLLEADLPPDQEIESGAIDQVKRIVSNRVNALGVVEPLVQTQGSRRIIVELPGVQDPEAAIATLRQTESPRIRRRRIRVSAHRQPDSDHLSPARVTGGNDPRRDAHRAYTDA